MINRSSINYFMFVLHHFHHVDQSNNIQQVYYLKGILLVNDLYRSLIWYSFSKTNTEQMYFFKANKI